MSKLFILNADFLEKEEFVKFKQVVATLPWTQEALFLFFFFNNWVKQDMKLNYIKKETVRLLYFACDI